MGWFSGVHVGWDWQRGAFEVLHLAEDPYCLRVPSDVCIFGGWLHLRCCTWKQNLKLLGCYIYIYIDFNFFLGEMGHVGWGWLGA